MPWALMWKVAHVCLFSHFQVPRHTHECTPAAGTPHLLSLTEIGHRMKGMYLLMAKV